MRRLEGEPDEESDGETWTDKGEPFGAVFGANRAVIPAAQYPATAAPVADAQIAAMRGSADNEGGRCEKPRGSCSMVGADSRKSSAGCSDAPSSDDASANAVVIPSCCSPRDSETSSGERPLDLAAMSFAIARNIKSRAPEYSSFVKRRSP